MLAARRPGGRRAARRRAGGATRARLRADLPRSRDVGRAVDLTFRATADSTASRSTGVLADDGVDARHRRARPAARGRRRRRGRGHRRDGRRRRQAGARRRARPDDGPLAGIHRVPAFAFPESAAAVLGRVARYAAGGGGAAGSRSSPSSSTSMRPAVVVAASRRLARRRPARRGRHDGAARRPACPSRRRGRCAAPRRPWRPVTRSATRSRSRRSVSPPSGPLGERRRRPRHARRRRAPHHLRADGGPSGRDDRGRRAADGARRGRDDRVRRQSTRLSDPVVSFGLGGAFADAIGDRAARACRSPISTPRTWSGRRGPSRAIEMVGQARGLITDVLCRVGYLVDNVARDRRTGAQPAARVARGPPWSMPTSGWRRSWPGPTTSPIFHTAAWSGGVSVQSGDQYLRLIQNSVTADDVYFASSAPFQAVSYKATGAPGAATATRYVGGTASVAPTTGVFVTGDWVVTQNGKIFICTSGGSPVPGKQLEEPLRLLLKVTCTPEMVPQTHVLQWALLMDLL